MKTQTFTTTFTPNKCKHHLYTYRSVRFNFWLFEVKKNFKVCHDCHELIFINKTIRSL